MIVGFSAGLLVMVPVLTASGPTSMCTPLRTLNDSLSHRRRYLVRGCKNTQGRVRLRKYTDPVESGNKQNFKNTFKV